MSLKEKAFTSSQTRPRPVIIFFALAFIFCISIALLEFICHIAYPLLTTASGRLRVELLSNDNLETNRLPHPYLLYQNNPNYIRNGIKEHNIHGFRNVEWSKKELKEFHKILVIGGSTTYAVGVKREESWPHLLEQEIKKSKPNTIVMNTGLAFATTAELLSHYIYRNRYFKPDLVIIHTGFNDSLTLLPDNYNPEYTHFRFPWQPLRARTYEKFLLKSGFIKCIYAWWLRGYGLNNSMTYQVESLPTHQANKNAKKHSPIGFERNLKLLIRQIKQDGSKVLLFPVPIARQSVFESLPPDSSYARSIYDAITISIKKNYEVMNQVESHVDKKTKILEIPDHQFSDHVHLHYGGQRAKVNFILKDVLDLLL